MLALLSALFLIVTTMNTLVVEQAAEIAILKTLGGRRRQIASIVLRAVALLGATRHRNCTGRRSMSGCFADRREVSSLDYGSGAS